MRAATGSHKLHIRRYGVQPLCPERKGFSVPVEYQFGVLLCHKQPSVKVRLIEKVAALVKPHKLDLAPISHPILNQIRHFDNRASRFD
jgi:hypothetical protein